MLLQTQSPTLRPQTTAHLAQTMTLLELNILELQEKIEAELSTNPALELVSGRRCPTCHRPIVNAGLCPVCSLPQTTNQQEPIVFVSPREYFASYSSAYVDRENKNGDDYVTDHEDLPAYVLRQIATEIKSDDQSIAAHILTSLDDDGLLSVPIVEIALYHHVPISMVENVIRIIQHADPTGVGSQNPQEALLVQLEVLSETQPVPTLATKAIQDGMDLLSRHQYSDLAKLLGISTKEAHGITQFISQNLNPYPARAFWGDIHQNAPEENQTYMYPDVIISLLNDTIDSPLVVEVISPIAGVLKINPLFREAVHQAPPEKAEQWQSEMDQAALLVKCIQQRNHTIVRLMKLLVLSQRDFILNGDTYLRPITRANLAIELGVHESTISRAVSNKTLQLPNGRIIPLSKFFDRSLQIRTVLVKIILDEVRPLTDTQITNILSEKGYPVARRTVAKYRLIEGIMPAYLRSKS